MHTYLENLMLISIVCAILMAMLPQKSKLTGYVKYVIALAAVLLLLSPITDALGDAKLTPQELPSDSEAEGSAREEYIKQGIAAIETGIRSGIAKKFTVPAENVDVQAQTREDGEYVLIEKITVTLRDYAMWADAGAIERYIEETYDLEAEVLNN